MDLKVREGPSVASLSIQGMNKRGDSVTDFKLAFRMWMFSAEAQLTVQVNAKAVCPGNRKDGPKGGFRLCNLADPGQLVTPGT